MSETAIFDTTREFQTRIAAVVGGPNSVHIGAPIKGEIGAALVSLLMFHTSVNTSLRNEIRYERPPLNAPAGVATEQIESLPLDLRYLITVFRNPDPSGQTANELDRLGKIIQTLHIQPTLTGPGMNGQVVRVSPEPYPMEELSRIWGLFGAAEYRSSIVYLATPVFIDAPLLPSGPPVTERRQTTGIFADVLDGDV